MSEKKQTTRKPTSNIMKNMNPNVNLALAIVLALVDLGVMYVMSSLTLFSNFSKVVFVAVNLLVMVVLLLINVLFIVAIKTKKKNLFQASVIIAVVFAILSGYGSFASYKLNNNVNKIITTGEQEEVVEAAIVAKTDISAISNLDGKTVGIITGAQCTEIGKSNIDNAVTSVDYVEYADINSLFTSLVADEVDAAVMPSNYKGIFESIDGYEDALKSVSTIETFKDTVTVTVDKSDKDITAEPISILVLGVDEGRSDANMLVTFNPVSLNITMTSLARDSFVPIACYSGQASDKLGHARAQGVQCTIDTIENLLDIEIDYYFESNFKGVVEIVDALGGIVIDNPYELKTQDSSSERGHVTVWIPAGKNVPVNGEQALGFARERYKYATGDFQRQANQQHVVERILKKAMETRDLNKLLGVLDAAGDNIKTNITVDQFVELFNHIMKKTSRIYDQSSLEKVFTITGSRVTGYNSSVWSEASQLAMSIVRPYEGSIKDNHDAIARNLDLNSAITAPKSFKFDANWEFYAPTISNETYSEAIVQSETPQSYWCKKSGGTWSGNACACPAGEFVENKGCVQDSADNYGTDANACIAAGFVFNEQTGYCVHTCPEGTVSDGKYCKPFKQAAEAYTDKDTCNANGYKWTGNSCVASCPAGTVDKDGVCAEEGPKQPTDFTTQQDCINGGFYWGGEKGCVAKCPDGTTEKDKVCIPVTPSTTPPTVPPTVNPNPPVEPTAPPHVHTPVEIVLVKPGCNTPGQAQQRCESCGDPLGEPYEIGSDNSLCPIETTPPAGGGTDPGTGEGTGGGENNGGQEGTTDPAPQTTADPNTEQPPADENTEGEVSVMLRSVMFKKINLLNKYSR